MSLCASSRSLSALVLALVLGPVGADRALADTGSADAGAGETAAASGAAEDALAAQVADLERQVAELRAAIERLRAAGTSPGDLDRRIEALSKEIERLRLGAAAGPAEATESIGGLGPAASKVYRAHRGVSIGGYGEFLYVDPAGSADDGTPSGQEPTADLLRAVLYFGYKFDDHFLFNSEIEFEHAVAAADAPGEVAVEFAYIDYKPGTKWGARGGLLLVPVGFLNELHEPPIFLGAIRPEVEQFIIPSTWRELGAGLYGDTGPVSWKAYLVTSLDATGFTAGEGIREGRQEGAEVAATDWALTARVDWVPVQGLSFGASGFAGDTAQATPGIDGGRMVQWEAHAEWRWHGLRSRALYARTSLDDAAAISTAVGETIGSQMNGYYGELGYDVLSRRRPGGPELVPFFRYEAFDTQAEVAAGFAADPAFDRSVRTYGVHFRPIPNIALKADFQDLGNSAGTGVDRFNLALGWLF
jgi:uncharacterized small protein (DUF1192 family)